MSSVVVVGAQWGDEGKGKVVDRLAPKADLVARYQGGNNAGHTVVVEGEQTIVHLLPSGILTPKSLNLIGPGVVVDPPTLLREIDTLTKRGIPCDPSRLRISGRAHVILPWHCALDNAREGAAGEKAIGTTGRGIGPAYEDKVARRGIRIIDLMDREGLRQRLENASKFKNFELTEFYKADPVDVEALYLEAVEWGKRLEPYVDNTGRILNQALRAGKNVLFEGAQGTFLDIDHGTYPFVTSSNTVAGGVCAGSGVGPTKIDRVIGITKAYTTRVGSGPFPTEEVGETGEAMRQAGAEFGATTGRPRRCGWLDLVVLREAVDLDGLTEFAMMKLDILSGFGEIRVATAYRIDGEVTESFPMTLEELARAEPIYEMLPGWDEDVSGARKFEDLPKNAQRYVEYVESQVEVPIALVSVGPGREATIVRSELFE
jgi:adenylosuccinate synthase